MTTPDAATARGGRLGAVALACAILVLASAAPAGAQWRPVVRSCASDGAVSGCTATSAFGGAWTVTVSPDGKFAYAAAFGSGAVHIYSRNAGTGALTHIGCVIEGGPASGCAGAHGISFPDSILVTANGKNLYVTGWNGSIAVFNRTPATGLLTQDAGTNGCINNDGSDACFDGLGVGGHGAVLSRDQRSIYVVGATTLSAFKRNLTTGTLTQMDPPSACFGSNPGELCTATPVDPGGRQIAISPDDKQVYVPTTAAGVLVFERDTTTTIGSLALKPGGQGCITQGGGGACGAPRPQLGVSTLATVLAPNGRQLYVLHNTGVTVFARNLTNGLLSYQSCINEAGNLGCANGRNVSGNYYGAVSPDGLDFVLNHGGGAGGISTLARASNGNLVPRLGSDSCVTVDGRGYDNGMTITGMCRQSNAVSAQGTVQFFGNQHFYAGGWPNGRIAAFKRDYYPVCQGRSVTVPRNTATAIALTCSDRNGDAVTRSIVAAPGAGTLGAINQASGSVFYDPFSNYSGTDRFTFRATAAGLSSTPATIAVTVPAPPRKRIRVRVGVSFSYLAYSDKTVLSKLRLKIKPRGARIRAVCTAHGRKCGGKANKAFLKKRSPRSVSLAKRFVGVDLPIGAKITIVVTKPRAVGAVKILTMRPRLAPKVTTRCLPPGAKKPKKRC